MKKGSKKCICCEEFYPEEEMMGSDFTGEPVCDICYSEDEAILTVFFGSDDEPHEVGSYRDGTEGEFKAIYHPTDGWRGYYDVESEYWTNIETDCILSYSSDAEELKKFDDELKEFLDNEGIDYARVFSRTSNLFSTGYDFFVRNESVGRVEESIKVLSIVTKLKAEYRDRERFNLTALTGKDEFDENDKLFLKCVSEIEKGRDIEEIKEELLEAI